MPIRKSHSHLQSAFFWHFVLLALITLLGIGLSIAAGIGACLYVDFLVPDSRARRLSWLILLSHWRVSLAIWTVAFLGTLLYSAYRRWTIFNQRVQPDPSLDNAFRTEIEAVSKHLSDFFTRTSCFPTKPRISVVQDEKPNIAVVPFPKNDPRIFITSSAARRDVREISDAAEIMSCYIHPDIACAAFISDLCVDLLSGPFVLCKNGLIQGFHLLTQRGSRMHVLEAQLGAIMCLFNVFCLPLTLAGGFLGHLLRIRTRNFLDICVLNRIGTLTSLRRASQLLKAGALEPNKSNPDVSRDFDQFETLFGIGVLSTTKHTLGYAERRANNEDANRLRLWQTCLAEYPQNELEGVESFPRIRNRMSCGLHDLIDRIGISTKPTAVEEELRAAMQNDPLLLHSFFYAISRVALETIVSPIESQEKFEKRLAIWKNVAPQFKLMNIYLMFLSEFAANGSDAFDSKTYWKGSFPVPVALHWVIVNLMSLCKNELEILSERDTRPPSQSDLSKLTEWITRAVPEISSDLYRQFRIQTTLGVVIEEHPSKLAEPCEIVSVLYRLGKLDNSQRQKIVKNLEQIFAIDLEPFPESQMFLVLFKSFLEHRETVEMLASG